MLFINSVEAISNFLICMSHYLQMKRWRLDFQKPVSVRKNNIQFYFKRLSSLKYSFPDLRMCKHYWRARNYFKTNLNETLFLSIFLSFLSLSCFLDDVMRRQYNVWVCYYHKLLQKAKDIVWKWSECLLSQSLYLDARNCPHYLDVKTDPWFLLTKLAYLLYDRHQVMIAP